MAIGDSKRWGGLRIEPYDPDARDADGDGIIQEGTAWERPLGTRILNSLGQEITTGLEADTRPTGLSIVDRDGNQVDYTPTYETPGSGVTSTGTALSEAGAISLRERGLPSIRDIVTPPESLVQREQLVPEDVPEPPRPEPEVAAEREPVVLDRDELPYIVGLPGGKEEGDDPQYVELKSSDRFSTDAERAKIADVISEVWGDFVDAKAEADRIVNEALRSVIDDYAKKDVLVAVPRWVMGQILKSGRIKSQHETGVSQGTLNPDLREAMENRQFNVPTDLDPRKRIIYGWIRGKQRYNGVESEVPFISPIYGSIYLRLKPRVKQRTTVTLGDSFVTGRFGVPLLSRIRRHLSARLDSERAMNDEREGRSIEMAVSERYFGTEVRSRIAEVLRAVDRRLADRYGDPEDFLGYEPNRYVEAQIHGGVDIEDIYAIEIDERELERESAQEWIAAARKKGIRVGTREQLDAGSYAGEVQGVEPIILRPIDELQKIRDESDGVNPTNYNTLDDAKEVMEGDGAKIHRGIAEGVISELDDRPAQIVDRFDQDVEIPRFGDGRHQMSPPWTGQGDEKTLREEYKNARFAPAWKKVVSMTIGRQLALHASVQELESFFEDFPLDWVLVINPNNGNIVWGPPSYYWSGDPYDVEWLQVGRLSPDYHVLLAEAVASHILGEWAAMGIQTEELQMAVARVFGIRDEMNLRDRTNEVIEAFERPVRQKICDTFIRINYEITQKYLKSLGVKSMLLSRGMRVWRGQGTALSTQLFNEMIDDAPFFDNTRGKVKTRIDGVGMRPMGSWSTSLRVVRTMFAGLSEEGNSRGLSEMFSIQMWATVDSELLLCSPLTGMGCLDEDEWLVIGDYSPEVNMTLHFPHHIDVGLEEYGQED